MRAADLARTHRERLVRNGFLLPVMKGWYIAGPGRWGQHCLVYVVLGLLRRLSPLPA